MVSIKKLKMLIAMSALVFVQAQAYDIDTHFYATAAILIKRGVKKEVAYKLAAYAQWIDESGLTTPMTTERKRRLFHFPTPLMLEEVPQPNPIEVGKFLASIEQKLSVSQLEQMISYTDRVHGKDLGVLSEVIENNPMAYDIMKKGFANGDFVLVGAGLHILMDSYGHSGFTAALGHANAGHDPDAPYKHIAKYYRMLQTAFKVTTVLLNALPEDAKDFTATITTKEGKVISAVDASAQEIYESFIAQPEVKTAIELNIQRSPSYTRVAVATILASMYKAGAIVDPTRINELLQNEEVFEREKTTPEIMTEIITEILSLNPEEIAKIVNVKVLENHYLREISMQLSIPQFIKESGGIESAATQLASVISRRFVAHNMDSEHQFVVDPEGVPREKEMSMRISNWQKVIEKLTGDRVVFDKGEKPKEYIKRTMIARLQSMANSKSRNPDFKPLSATDITQMEKGLEGIKIGVNFKEQAAWNWRMFNIVYIDLLRYVEVKWNFKISDFKIAEGFKNKWWYFATTMGWNGLESIPGSHNVVDPEVFYIREEEEFKKALDEGLFKKIITPKQVRSLETQFRKRNIDTNGNLIVMCKDVGL